MATIQGVYMALFGRPADPLGLAFFNTATGNGANLAPLSLIDSTPEFQSRFAGLTPAATINKIYQSLFGRDADQPGLNFFLNALDQKLITSVSKLAITIIDGARGDDLITLNNKLAAANAFTAAVDTAAEISGYAGSASIAIARAFLESVTTTVPSAATVDNAVLRATGTGEIVLLVDSPAVPTVLTTNTDDFTGTSAAQNYVGVAATASPTFNATDSVDGGGGTDRLDLTINALAANSVPAARFSSVENIYVRNISGNDQTIDGKNFIGHEQIWSDRSTSKLTLGNLASGAVIGLQGDGSTILSLVNATYVAGATAATLSIANGTNANGASDVVIGGATLNSLTINSTGAANTIDDIGVVSTIKSVIINASTNLTIGAQAGGTGLSGAGSNSTLTISGGAASVVLADPLNQSFSSVDASGLTAGGATIILDGDADTVFKGGKGNDVVTTGAVLTTGSADAGDGTGDRLIVSSTAHLADAALGAKYTNFEQLQVNTGVTVDLDNISGIKSIIINDAAGVTGVTNLTAEQAASITIIASSGGLQGNITIGVKGATNVGQTDAVVIKVDDGQAAKASYSLETPLIAGVEKLTINAVDDVVIKSLTGAPAIDTVTVTGSGNVNLTTGSHSVANFKIDATSHSGNLTASAAGSTTSVTMVTGAGRGTLSGSGLADDFKTGAGGATIVGDNGADRIDLTASTGVSDTLLLAPGQSPSTGFDQVVGFNNAATTGDRFNIAGGAIIGSNAPAGTATGIANLTIAANAGVITFGGSLAGTATLAQKIAAVAFVAEADIESYAFEHAGNTYFFLNGDIGAASGTLTGADLVVELTGVTGVSALSQTASSATTLWMG